MQHYPTIYLFCLQAYENCLCILIGDARNWLYLFVSQQESLSAWALTESRPALSSGRQYINPLKHRLQSCVSLWFVLWFFFSCKQVGSVNSSAACIFVIGTFGSLMTVVWVGVFCWWFFFFFGRSSICIIAWNCKVPCSPLFSHLQVDGINFTNILQCLDLLQLWMKALPQKSNRFHSYFCKKTLLFCVCYENGMDYLASSSAFLAWWN